MIAEFRDSANVLAYQRPPIDNSAIDFYDVGMFATSIHQRLIRRYRWYRKWHSLPFAQTIHFLVFILAISYCVYLALEIHYYIVQL